MTATRVDVRAELEAVIAKVEDALRAYQNLAALGLVRSARLGAVTDALLNARAELWKVRDAK